TRRTVAALLAQGLRAARETSRFALKSRHAAKLATPGTLSGPARPRFIGRTIFHTEAFSLERSAHACGQAQALGHSISRLGAQRSHASRAETHRQRGRFTIGARSVTIELNIKPPPTLG